MNWMSVEDHLPGVGEMVLVACPGRKSAMFGRYLGDGIWRMAYGSRVVCDVTHWMPRPKLPYEYKWTPRRRRGKCWAG
jgi:hypothetical protein